MTHGTWHRRYACLVTMSPAGIDPALSARKAVVLPLDDGDVACYRFLAFGLATARGLLCARTLCGRAAFAAGCATLSAGTGGVAGAVASGATSAAAAESASASSVSFGTTRATEATRSF